MHPYALTCERYADDYKQWLQQRHDFPIYMHHVHTDIHNSVQFPREKITQYRGNLFQKGGQFVKDFYAESSTYMMALALHLGYRRLELYGIDLNKLENKQRRDSVFFWLGILQANHMQIVIHEDSPLISEALYPFY